MCGHSPLTELTFFFLFQSANLFGLSADLGLTTQQYSACLAVLYV